MPATLHWQLRQHLHEFKPAVRLSVLTALILHANIRLRCFPSLDTLCAETGYGREAVNEAKQWLRQSAAFVLVPHRKRMDEECKLPPRQHVYQLTGVIRLGGEIVPYLFMTPEAQAAVEAIAARLTIPESSEIEPSGFKSSKIESSKIESSKIEPKGSSIFKGVSISEGVAAPQPEPRDSTPIPFHIANGLGMTRVTHPENNPTVRAVLEHPYWHAFARGWDGIVPDLQPTLADIALEACKMLAEKATLEEVEALTREKISNPKRTGDYRISFVLTDLPQFRARRRAKEQAAANPSRPELRPHVANAAAETLSDADRARMLAELKRVRKEVSVG